MEPSATLVPQYLPLPSGRLFAVLHQPKSNATGEVILLLPPFAEELNKSRRQINAQAQQFCQAGIAVLIVDWYGTGDSEGGFVEGTIDSWQQNCTQSIEWLQERGFTSVKLWAVRFGALLLEHALSTSVLPVSQIILWQPVMSGAQALGQFLRLQTAANMMKDGAGQSAADLQELLKTGQSVQVAGYTLSSDLYIQAQALKLLNFKAGSGLHIDWFQVVSGERNSLPMTVNKAAENWRHQGAEVTVHKVTGDPFWATAELVLVRSMVERTTRVAVGQIESGVH